MIYVGQIHSPWAIFRSQIFNFSRKFFRNYGISIFKRNNALHFCCRNFIDFNPKAKRYLLNEAKNLPVGEDCNINYVFQIILTL